jgi:phosphoglucosamine mutase
MSKCFGTDGVRGPVGGPLINAEFVARLGFAAGRWSGGRGVALIGRDTRRSGESLELALSAGLRAAGLEPISLGVLPTPAVARAVRQRGAALGVVVTASHNPASDNGIKFFGPGGLKLSDSDEHAIEATLEKHDHAFSGQAAAPAFDGDALAEYRQAAASLLPADSLRGWRIVVDAAHGAAHASTPEVLRVLGAEVVALGTEPDGENINADQGSEHPQHMAARVLGSAARVGLAHDGDGDRLVVADERGSVLDGDEVLAVLALHALRVNRLAGRLLVVTVQSNLGLDAAVTAAGGRVLRSAVGDRNVLQLMRAHGASLGGESSGHIICGDISPTGDGLAAALRLLQVMRDTGRSLSELRRELVLFPQRSIALRVTEKRPLASLPTLGAVMQDLERELGPRGRLLVRYSGTEAKLRLLVEGPENAVVARGLFRLEAAARSDLNVIG